MVTVVVGGGLLRRPTRDNQKRRPGTVIVIVGNGLVTCAMLTVGTLAVRDAIIRPRYWLRPAGVLVFTIVSAAGAVGFLAITLLGR